jgi:hypothetical protein
MRNTQHRRPRATRSTFLYDLTVLLDEFDHNETENRVYVRDLVGKFKEVETDN